MYSSFTKIAGKAGIAQLVERNLAKVEVAGSRPVSRSKRYPGMRISPFSPRYNPSPRSIRQYFECIGKYIWSAPRCKEKVQRRDIGSSANIYPALTEEATSSLWPQWKSACSDLIETEALEIASFFLRFLGNTGSTFYTIIQLYPRNYMTGNSNATYD